MLAVIEWGKIGQVIWVSAVMGVLAILLFAVAIYGGSRAAEARRTNEGPATAYAAVGMVGLAAFAALVIFAITVILHKS